jgi:hypothetical protein
VGGELGSSLWPGAIANSSPLWFADPWDLSLFRCAFAWGGGGSGGESLSSEFFLFFLPFGCSSVRCGRLRRIGLRGGISRLLELGELGRGRS